VVDLLLDRSRRRSKACESGRLALVLRCEAGVCVCDLRRGRGEAEAEERCGVGVRERCRGVFVADRASGVGERRGGVSFRVCGTAGTGGMVEIATTDGTDTAEAEGGGRAYMTPTMSMGPKPEKSCVI
jgi:hypothetical protein